MESPRILATGQSVSVVPVPNYVPVDPPANHYAPPKYEDLFPEKSQENHHM